MGVQPANVVDADMALELFSSFSSFLEEVRPKPNLL
jgi:hypothetical protein